MCKRPNCTTSARELRRPSSCENWRAVTWGRSNCFRDVVFHPSERSHQSFGNEGSSVSSFSFQTLSGVPIYCLGNRQHNSGSLPEESIDWKTAWWSSHSVLTGAKDLERESARTFRQPGICLTTRRIWNWEHRYSFIFSSIGPRLLRIGKPLFLSWKFSLLICLGGCRGKMSWPYSQTLP
jgi:hypothetical protein